MLKIITKYVKTFAFNNKADILFNFTNWGNAILI